MSRMERCLVLMISSAIAFSQDASGVPVRTLQGLTSISFIEVSGSPSTYTYVPTDAVLKTQLSGLLTSGNRDFGGVPGEHYDVYYSDANGSFNLDGECVSIEGVFGQTTGGGGLNLAEMILNFGAQKEYGDNVSSFVALGANALPSSVGNAVDANIATATTMGNTVGQGNTRLRVTVCFRSSSSPPPPERQSTNTYAAKFICGVQKDADITHVPDAQAGRYSTKINVHNNTGVQVNFRKKIIPLRGGQVPLEPKFKIYEELRPDFAMEVVCSDIYRHLKINIPPGSVPPYVEGFVILEVYFNVSLGKPIVPPPDPLDVVGVYTYKGDLQGAGTAAGSGVSIEVVVYPAKSNAHVLD